MKCNLYITCNKARLQKLYTTFVFLILSIGVPAQYYIRGEVRDEKNQPLQNVKIYLHSTHLLYFSGSSGGFGILTANLYDSLTFNAEGYEAKSVRVRSDVYQEVSLKLFASNANLQKPKLISVTEDLDTRANSRLVFGNESYSSLVENDFVKAAKYPTTGFSVRIDKASYSNVRRFINQKAAVPPDAVRIEEMLNYFNFNYREPPKNETFGIESQLTSCPWNDGHQLLFINLNAKKLDLENIPPSNFVFLIDVSGSMDLPNKLPLLKASFQSLIKNLREKDTVSIVTYGGTVEVVLHPTCGADKQKIIKAIEELNAAGDTPGEAAIHAAYTLARNSFIQGGNNRIILATDGDFNVGESGEKALGDLVTKERQSGIYLTCLGVGMGNYKDSKMEALAKKGNGNFAYLDDIREGEKVLVKELTQNLYTVANDVFLNVQFNPSVVKEYRLIGYDNKKNAIADSTNRLEGGEVGSGNGITAVFEIVPVFESIYDDPWLTDNIAYIKLSYRLTDDTSQKHLAYVCPAEFTEFKSLCSDLKFATAVTMFGLLLRDSQYAQGISWTDIGEIALEAKNPEDYLQNEFISLVEKAKKLYPKKNKKIRKVKTN